MMVHVVAHRIEEFEGKQGCPNPTGSLMRFFTFFRVSEKFALTEGEFVRYG